MPNKKDLYALWGLIKFLARFATYVFHFVCERDIVCPCDNYNTYMSVKWEK